MRALAVAAAVVLALMATAANAAETLSLGLAVTSPAVQPKPATTPPVVTGPSFDFSQAANSQYLGG